MRAASSIVFGLPKLCSHGAPCERTAHSASTANERSLRGNRRKGAPGLLLLCAPKSVCSIWTLFSRLSRRYDAVVRGATTCASVENLPFLQEPTAYLGDPCVRCLPVGRPHYHPQSTRNLFACHDRHDYSYYYSCKTCCLCIWRLHLLSASLSAPLPRVIFC